MDAETTGLRWWGDDRPIGFSVTLPDGRTRYLPFRHSGGNLDEERVKEWARRELRDREVVFFNAPFDVSMFYVWGIDLESQGCRVRDVGNWAALLDEYRRDTGLDSVATEYLGIGKLDAGLDKTRMATYHAADVAPYAGRDSGLLHALCEKLDPMIVAERLGKVRDLEDDIIYATCEMIRNGAHLNEERLHEWIKRSDSDMIKTQWELYEATGLRINPRSRPDKIRLFEKICVPPPTVTEEGPDYGKITFKRQYLKEVEHPIARKLLHATRLASLQDKFLYRYRDELARNGILRYSLHQLRVDNEGGTVSGRYSSSAFGTNPPEGVNIQQVAGKKQENDLEDDSELAGYVVRELFVPGSGLWLSADAEQIEYRLFAHYARPPRVMEAYARDPWTDFHNVVMEMVARVRKLTRPRTKDLNFAKIYGAQLKKIAKMMGCSEGEARSFVRAYDQEFPEAERLLKKASRLAEDRGYVTTMMGRRARFLRGQLTYSALNRVIQGTAAEEMKIKIRELHRARKHTGYKMRFAVHDETNGDVPDAESMRRVAEVLNTQILKTRVPLLWGIGVGQTWQGAKLDADARKKVKKDEDYENVHVIEERQKHPDRRGRREHPNIKGKII